jgi:FixJ family two-component response regulator
MTTQQAVIAVVDDDPKLRTSLRRLLSTYGYRTELFASGAECLDAITKRDVACYLIDIQLGGGESGILLARQLAAAGVATPFIHMSGSDIGALRAEAIASGCAAYLDKPFRAEDLVAAIEKAIGPRAG